MFYLRLTLIAVVVATLAGCDAITPSNMLTNGEIEHFHVDELGYLSGPWHGVDKASLDGGIPLEGQSRVAGDENFVLSFDTGFLKYLPDPGGVNEVVVLFTFREGRPATEGDPEKEIVKVLGPLRRQPDGKLLPDIHRITFGPTALARSPLSVKIEIYEFDAEEAQDSAAFIDFVGSAAQKLALADPVTAAEIAVAKEIAKVIAESNENDLVLRAGFDLVAYDPDVWARPANQRSHAIPLRAGSFGLIKTEHPFLLYEFFPKVQALQYNDLTAIPAFPFALAVDLVLLPFTGILRGFTDTPDHKSLTDLTHDASGRVKDGELLRWDHDSRRITGDDGETYRNKTWLTFSITKGHHPLPKSARGALWDAEQTILGLLRDRSISEVLSGSGLLKAIEDLHEVRETAKAAETAGAFKLVTPITGLLNAQTGTTAQDLVIAIPPKATVDLAKLTLTNSKSEAAGASWTATTTKITEDRYKLSFNKNLPLKVGRYELSVAYALNGQSKMAYLRVEVIPSPDAVLGKVDGTWKQGAKQTIAVAKAGHQFRHITSARVEVTALVGDANQPVEKKVTLTLKASEMHIGETEIRVRKGITKTAIKSIDKVTLSRTEPLSEVVIAASAPTNP